MQVIGPGALAGLELDQGAADLFGAELGADACRGRLERLAVTKGLALGLGEVDDGWLVRHGVLPVMMSVRYTPSLAGLHTARR